MPRQERRGVGLRATAWDGWAPRWSGAKDRARVTAAQGRAAGITPLLLLLPVGAHPVRDKPTERHIATPQSRTGCAPTVL